MLRGNIDKISRKTISGWVDDDEKSGPLLIDVFVNGVAVTNNTEASHYRPDLKNLNIGDGFRGFVITVDLPKDRCEYAVALCLAGTTEPVMRKTVELLPEASHIAPITEEILSGFLVWTDSDEESVQIELKVNGIHLCSPLAYAPEAGDNRGYFKADSAGISTDLKTLFARKSAKQSIDGAEEAEPLAYMTMYRPSENLLMLQGRR